MPRKPKPKPSDFLEFDYVRITVHAPRPCPGPPVHDCTDRNHPRWVHLIPLEPLRVHPLDRVTVELLPALGDPSRAGGSDA
jgi:hypothetical protein